MLELHFLQPGNHALWESRLQRCTPTKANDARLLTDDPLQDFTLLVIFSNSVDLFILKVRFSPFSYKGGGPLPPQDQPPPSRKIHHPDHDIYIRQFKTGSGSGSGSMNT